MQNKPIFLSIKWTVSRGRDTYGYNIVTLTTPQGEKHRCNGGGYDMQGTVFAQWLMANYKERIKALPTDDGKRRYGLTHTPEHFYLDGACGLDCMVAIAEEIGLDVTRSYGPRSGLQGFVVIDTKAKVAE